MAAVQNLNTEELRAYAKMLRLSNLRSNCSREYQVPSSRVRATSFSAIPAAFVAVNTPKLRKPHG